MVTKKNCGALDLKDLDQRVQLHGWVQRIRDKGKLLWIDLRDRFGVTQLILDGTASSKLFEQARRIGREAVIQVVGHVQKRQIPNTQLATGEIEVRVDQLVLLNPSKTPPFLIEDTTDGKVPLRMAYRYLDLRRPKMQRYLRLRHQVLQQVRHFMEAHGFIEVETPLLVRSTPEGARDFVVPSRLYPNQYYALPQSPQLFKQLLMVAGVDRYFQVARCFRDEDFRIDRQPEFTQIDCELSFCSQETIQTLIEQLIRQLFKEVRGITLPPFLRLTYQEAMARYGSDRPDLRFDMAFLPLDSWTRGQHINFLDHAELIRGIVVPGGGKLSRKEVAAWSANFEQNYPVVTGPFTLKQDAQQVWKSSLGRRIDSAHAAVWANELGMGPDDLLIGVAGPRAMALKALGVIRLRAAQQMNLIAPKALAPLWVTDFPLLTWEPHEKRYTATHHPFTAPLEADLEALHRGDLDNVRAQAYDLVINGLEVGGGSIRNHRFEEQQAIFKRLGFTDKQMTDAFGFLLEALQYGAPPHGGFAIGLARLCNLIAQEGVLRDFIAFPKNSAAKDSLIGAPSTI